ncbi:hypothetical protein FKM82_012398 [Ascaphus truei]
MPHVSTHYSKNFQSMDLQPMESFLSFKTSLLHPQVTPTNFVTTYNVILSNCVVQHALPVLLWHPRHTKPEPQGSMEEISHSF